MNFGIEFKKNLSFYTAIETFTAHAYVYRPAIYIPISNSNELILITEQYKLYC